MVRAATPENSASDGLRRPRRECRSGEPGAENPHAGFCGGRTVQGVGPRPSSTHHKIKVLKRMAYGYRDDGYFFLKIMDAFPGVSG